MIFSANEWVQTLDIYKSDIYRKLLSLRNRTFAPPFAFDSPEHCRLGPQYWHQYSVTQYDYQYNSWGFRGPDYEQYQGQKINVCIGDSTTVNLGGPIEHSWPYHLSKYFNIPTLNFGISGLSYHGMAQIVSRVKTLFDVERVFVLYNLFDTTEDPVDLPMPIYNNANIEHKIGLLKNHCWILGAYWQFDPPWTFWPDELKAFYHAFPNAHNFLKHRPVNRRSIAIETLLASDTLRFKYMDLAGRDWPSYEKFLQHFLLGTDLDHIYTVSIDQKLIREFVTDHVNPWIDRALCANRDGWHMSNFMNRCLADYFYQQTKVC